MDYSYVLKRVAIGKGFNMPLTIEYSDAGDAHGHLEFCCRHGLLYTRKVIHNLVPMMLIAGFKIILAGISPFVFASLNGPWQRDLCRYHQIQQLHLRFGSAPHVPRLRAVSQWLMLSVAL